VRERITELGIDGKPVMIVVNVLDAVTVMVTTRCRGGFPAATEQALLQSLDGVV
jgi:hypothetical protein